MNTSKASFGVMSLSQSSKYLISDIEFISQQVKHMKKRNYALAFITAETTKALNNKQCFSVA